MGGRGRGVGGGEVQTPPLPHPEIPAVSCIVHLALTLALGSRVDPLTVSSSGLEGPDMMCWEI